MLLALTQPWLVVSDLHVEPFDRSPQVSDYGSDTNWTLLDATIAQMRRVEPNPAVVVIPGDFLAHHFDAKVRAKKERESTAAAAEAVMERIERSFARAFPKAQFLIAMGNNDDPCGDYSTAPNSRYLRRVAQIWAPLVDRGGAAPGFQRAFSHAGYYTARLPGAGLRAVVLDSVYWSILYRPCGSGGRSAAAQQMAWLRATLADAGGAHTVLIMHIPPGIDATSTLITHRFLLVPFLRTGEANQLAGAVAANRARVPLLIAGHLHQNDFRLVGGAPMLIASSVSPVYNNNPSFLRLDMDADGTLHDYRLYGYDIDAGTWSQIADFDRAYGVSGFTADALAAAHQRIANDSDVREAWANATAAGSRSSRVDRGNWKAYWCAQTDTGAGYAACAGDRRRTAVLPLAIAIGGILVVLGVVALVFRLASQRRRA